MTSPEAPGPAVVAPKRGPSCWLVGGLGCFAFLVIVLALGGLEVWSAFRTPEGKQLLTGLKVGLNQTKLVPDCDDRMVAVRQALIRFDLKNAHYPAKLTDLVPLYLPDPSQLHSALDSNSDPKHVSFAYSPPPPGAPSDTNLLSITWSFTMQVVDKKVVTKQVRYLTLGGDFVQEQYQNNKLVTSPLASPS